MPERTAVVADPRRGGERRPCADEIVAAHAVEAEAEKRQRCGRDAQRDLRLGARAQGHERPVDVVVEGWRRVTPLQREQQARGDAKERQRVGIVGRGRGCDAAGARFERDIRQVVEQRALHQAAGRQLQAQRIVVVLEAVLRLQPFGAREGQVLELQDVAAPETAPRRVAAGTAQRLAQGVQAAAAQQRFAIGRAGNSPRRRAGRRRLPARSADGAVVCSRVRLLENQRRKAYSCRGATRSAACSAGTTPDEGVRRLLSARMIRAASGGVAVAARQRCEEEQSQAEQRQRLRFRNSADGHLADLPGIAHPAQVRVDWRQCRN